DCALANTRHCTGDPPGRPYRFATSKSRGCRRMPLHGRNALCPYVPARGLAPRKHTSLYGRPAGTPLPFRHVEITRLQTDAFARAQRIVSVGPRTGISPSQTHVIVRATRRVAPTVSPRRNHAAADGCRCTGATHCAPTSPHGD